MSWTLQKIFDTVAGALLRQGAKSIDEWGFCRYRGQGGLKCAAGHLIPDCLYSPSMESKAVCTEARDIELLPMDGAFEILESLLQAGILSPDTKVRVRQERLIAGLQCAHDGNPPEGWRTKLRQVARHYKLSPRVLGRKRS